MSAHATSIGKTESRSPASEKPGTVAIANLDEVQDISDEPSVPAVEVPPTAVSTTTQEQSLIDTTEQLSNTFSKHMCVCVCVCACMCVCRLIVCVYVCVCVHVCSL